MAEERSGNYHVIVKYKKGRRTKTYAEEYTSAPDISYDGTFVHIHGDLYEHRMFDTDRRIAFPVKDVISIICQWQGCCGCNDHDKPRGKVFPFWRLG